ncbi:MAG TPA: hypothetical protein VFL31_05610, partial [Nitrospiraceae bacterium]|nr:hypothetical protein [Nitrospiraceae bacterium]
KIFASLASHGIHKLGDKVDTPQYIFFKGRSWAVLCAAKAITETSDARIQRRRNIFMATSFLYVNRSAKQALGRRRDEHTSGL